MKREAAIDARGSGPRPWVGAALQTRQAADLALLKIEAALADARAAVRAELQMMTALMEPVPGAAAGLTRFFSPLLRLFRPTRVPPPFANPYANLGARLLADFDELVFAILAARQRALIGRDRAYSLLFCAGRPLRRIYAMPAANWRHTGVTRKDVREDTRLARQARAVYARINIHGIPADVLQGTERGVHAPPLRKARPARGTPCVPRRCANPESPTEGTA